MTDVEVGLARAMLAKGMKNDQVHFYFNRADRLISSGRIAQIKDGSYAKDVAAAANDELADFITKWDAEHAAIYPKGPQSPTDPDFIDALFEKRKSGWHVRHGETDIVECKLNYAVSGKILRAIAGLANNKGGHILFGIRNEATIVDGMSDDKFETLDPALLTSHLVSFLDPVPTVTRIPHVIGGRKIGVLYVERHERAPIIVLKGMGNDLREGAVYFRYVGETRQIKPGEMRAIIEAREARAVAEFSRRMSRVASGAGATIDLDTGEVTGRTGSFVIDRELLPSIQFVREGDFSQTKGAPTLRLVGDVQPMSAADRDRIHVVRDNIPPNSIVENFLDDNQVRDPLAYLHAQAYYQRKWMPIWHYVHQLSMSIDDLVEDLRRLTACMPSSRDAIVQRLRGTQSAYKIYTGKPKAMLTDLRAGKVKTPKNDFDLSAFAYALHGLPNDFEEIEKIRPIILECLKRDKAEKHRSQIYRAACRVDEIIHYQRK
ncbi:AlbA family DNA-binding domain-containing protein [Bradyrhizobium diazoefficiens]|uniref:AlbA family DNA-binding domain-containing protein n=1 Tax=Bradyrhizobium diazoefficiens TaxID=1355477 RepID=UPI0027155829|nr:ATP-binding protein [Bradyrhizobium diazoefficiens]WLC16282.1 ATP-binding protein [Bradyrhizobium diazoefficiens]